MAKEKKASKKSREERVTGKPLAEDALGKKDKDSREYRATHPKKKVRTDG